MEYFFPFFQATLLYASSVLDMQQTCLILDKEIK
jgi:hypothetical protein